MLKKIAVSLFLFGGLSAFGQNLSVVPVVVPPSSCYPVPIYEYQTGSTIYISGPGNTCVAVGASATPSGPAGGVLSGTYPNPGLSTSPQALPNGWTATTQSAGDNSTNVATTAYVDTGLSGKQASGTYVTPTTLNNGTLPGSFTTVAASTSVTAGPDGVHPGQLALVGNTTLPTLSANTQEHLGPPAATFTAWSDQAPSAIPTNLHGVYCAVTGTNCLWTDTGYAYNSIPVADLSAAINLAASGAGGVTGVLPVANQAVTYGAVIGTPYDATALGADFAAQTLLTTPAATGRYMVCIQEFITQAATSSSTMPAITINYTAPDDSVSRQQNVTFNQTWNATWGTQGGCQPVYAKGSTTIAVQSSGYATSGATSMQFSAHAWIQSANPAGN